MSGDGGGDSDSDGEKGGGFGGFASSVGDALSELSDAAGQAARDAASREEAAASMSSVGVSNMSGMDTFSPSTGKSTSTAATASSSNRGTSGSTSGFGLGSPGRDSTGVGVSVGGGTSVNDRVSGAFDVVAATSPTPADRVDSAFSAFSPAAVSRSGFGIDLGAALNPEPLASQGNLMEAFNPVAASNMPGVTSPDRMSTLTDTMTYTAPSNTRSVDTFSVHADPAGHNAQATERAGRFSTSPLSGDEFAGYRGVLDLAIKAEARKTNPYNSLVYGKVPGTTPSHANLTEMTVAEVMDLQKTMPALGFASTALGAYQTMAATLGEMVTQLDIDPNTTMFDQQTQDRIGAALMDRRGYKDHKAGKISADQFADNLAKEWAGFADRTGKSHYAGINGNKANVSRADVMSAVGANPAAAPDPNAFTGELNVAMAPTGVQLDSVDLPGSRSFADNQTAAAVGTPDAKPGSTTAVAAFDNAVGPLADRAFAGPMPTTTDELAAAIGAPTQVAANTSMGRLESTYLDPDVRSVTTQTISVSPSTQQASTVAANTADVRSTPTTTAMGYQPTTTTTAPTPQDVQPQTGLNNTAKTVISTGVDAAVGAVPGIGLVNTAAAGVNLVGDLVGADINVPTVGSLVANALDRSAQGDWDGTAPDISETDPSEVAEAEADIADDTSQEAASAAIDDDPVVRLETRYLSPYPTPAERWGPNARQYRGA